MKDKKICVSRVNNNSVISISYFPAAVAFSDLIDTYCDILLLLLLSNDEHIQKLYFSRLLHVSQITWKCKEKLLSVQMYTMYRPEGYFNLKIQ